MHSAIPTVPEAGHQEPVIKQEFTSFAPWNQFAPDQLVIDNSSDDDDSHTDNLNKDQPQASASFAFSSMSTAAETNPSTMDIASSMSGCAPHVTFKQELDDFSKAVKGGLKFVRTPLISQGDGSEGGVPAILDQLPSLDTYQTSRIWDDPATPMLLPEVQYFITYWRVALFAVGVNYIQPAAESLVAE